MRAMGKAITAQTAIVSKLKKQYNLAMGSAHVAQNAAAKDAALTQISKVSDKLNKAHWKLQDMQAKFDKMQKAYGGKTSASDLPF